MIYIQRNQSHTDKSVTQFEGLKYTKIFYIILDNISIWKIQSLHF